MEAKEIIGISIAVIILGGLVFMLIRNRRKQSETAKRPACLYGQTGRNCSVVLFDPD